jgi:hypothetical protein
MALAEQATSCHSRESGDPYSRGRSVGRHGSPLSRGRQAVIGQALSHTLVASIGSFSDPSASPVLRGRSGRQRLWVERVDDGLQDLVYARWQRLRVERHRIYHRPHDHLGALVADTSRELCSGRVTGVSSSGSSDRFYIRPRVVRVKAIGVATQALPAVERSSNGPLTRAARPGRAIFIKAFWSPAACCD